MSPTFRLLLVHALAAVLGMGAGVVQAQTADEPTRARATARSAPNVSARSHVGKASIYAWRFANRKMANGEPMDPHGDNAAHRTLPLGTRALVKNLATGKSAVVTIKDRGPYVRGRIIDLSPATAKQIGLTRRKGVTTVEVTPLHLPPRQDRDRPVATR